jgi:hypothetical protein
MPPRSDRRLSEKEARTAEVFLGDADREILLTLYATRFATVPQMERLLGVAQPVVHRRLMRLYRYRYLDRQPWGFRHVYTLDALGVEFAAQATGVPREKRLRLRRVSPYFLDHHVAVGDVYIALTLAGRRDGLTLSWRNEVEAADAYALPSGQPRKLEPDAIFTLLGPEMSTIFAFLEVDRATESWQQWGQKVRDYTDCFLSGRFAERWQAAPRVVVLVTAPDLRRLESLRTFTAERWPAQLAAGPVPVGFTVHGAVTPDRVLGLPWAGLEQHSSFRLVESVP